MLMIIPAIEYCYIQSTYISSAVCTYTNVSKPNKVCKVRELGLGFTRVFLHSTLGFASNVNDKSLSYDKIR